MGLHGVSQGELYLSSLYLAAFLLKVEAHSLETSLRIISDYRISHTVC
jgi:hypothetical protein